MQASNSTAALERPHSDTAELERNSQQQASMLRRIEHERRTGSKCIKHLSNLIDQLDCLKRERRKLLLGKLLTLH
ncbi:hypothetical protein AB4Z29_24950 [Paenibacillus sp. 2TAB23]|uniref:hypothetical protein n=1 Tax=Paenibacillus sp. 2TAB23 TaxID=3233004 RepID=UPI003F9CE288